MKITRCQKGHFYNKSKHSSCPFCKRSEATKTNSSIPDVNSNQECSVIPKAIPMPPSSPDTNTSQKTDSPHTSLNFGFIGPVMGYTIPRNDKPFCSEDPVTYAYLIRIKNDEKIILNKPVFRIGKEKSYVDYYIGDNPSISRCHANFIMRDGEYFVVDTYSTNHIYVNGMMIQCGEEIKIHHGDKISLSNEDFYFRMQWRGLKMAQEIYSAVIEDILKNVSIKNRSTIKQCYKAYLIDLYSKYETKSSNEKLVNAYIETEKMRFQSKTEQQILSALVKDKAFIRIKELSAEALYSAAKRKNNGIITYEELNTLREHREEMKELLTDVKSFNIEQAKRSIADGLTDYGYALNESPFTSLRVN